MARFPTGRLFVVFVVGAMLEPVGHAAAYMVRYGPSQAWLIESQGTHAYFPRVFSLSAFSMLVALGLAMVGVVAIRLILGSGQVRVAGVGGTFAILALTQCTLFSVKESLEAFAVQTSPDLMTIGILAVIVQLPLAALAAWLIGWIRGYLDLAPEAIRAMLAVRLSPPRIRCIARPVAALALATSLRDQRCYQRRGPPLSI